MSNITKADVLTILNGRIAQSMNFSVENITVNGNEYSNVSEYIDGDDIRVVPGTGSDAAFYDGHKNIIITGASRKPLSDGDQAQILHECTHAIVDINKLDVEKLTEEVASYLAQATFTAIYYPTKFKLYSGPRVRARPFTNFTFALDDVVEKYNLHNTRGRGARISASDIWNLRTLLHQVPDYGHIGVHDKAPWAGFGAPDAGVPIKNPMHALRAATKRAHRKEYKPSPRLMIF